MQNLGHNIDTQKPNYIKNFLCYPMILLFYCSIGTFPRMPTKKIPEHVRCTQLAMQFSSDNQKRIWDDERWLKENVDLLFAHLKNMISGIGKCNLYHIRSNNYNWKKNLHTIYNDLPYER